MYVSGVDERFAGKRPKARGILFKDSKGNKHIAYLNKGDQNEVIVSAGALGSPQLMMLSGIGPARKLRAQGIRVVLNQAMVGQGMSDNPLNAFTIPSRRKIDASLVQVVGITNVGVFVEAANGEFSPSTIFAMSQPLDYAAAENRVSLTLVCVHVLIKQQEINLQN